MTRLTLCIFFVKAAFVQAQSEWLRKDTVMFSLPSPVLYRWFVNVCSSTSRNISRHLIGQFSYDLFHEQLKEKLFGENFSFCVFFWKQKAL